MENKKKTKANRNRVDISRVADELLQMAEEGGAEQNFFFQTTFNRYKVQLNTLTRLQKEIADNDLLVTKEYVKGRENLVANPAIAEYNKTSTAANQTVQTLLKIITTFANGSILGRSDDGDCDL